MARACLALLLLLGTALGQFAADCPSQSLLTTPITIDYQMGSDQAVSKPAVHFTVSFPTGSWAAIGFKATGGAGSKMTGLNIIAFDSATAQVQNTDVPTDNVKPAIGTLRSTYDTMSSSAGTTTLKFYRRLDEMDGSFVIPTGTGFTVAWATGSGAVAAWTGHTARGFVENTVFTPCTSAPDTPAPATPAPPTASPTGQFTAECPSQSLLTTPIAIDYEMGTDQAVSRPAVLFTVSFPTGSWAAVGVKDTGGAGSNMTDLNIVAFDSATAQVQDTDVPTDNVKPTIGTLLSTYVDMSSSAGTTTLRFYRRLDEMDGGFVIPNGTGFTVAWATGSGTVATWTGHTARGFVENTVFTPCTSAPDTPAPATPAPATPTPPAPPTPAPDTPAPATLTPGDTYPPNTPAPATSAPATPAPATNVPVTLTPGDTYPPNTPAPATSAPATPAPNTTAPATLAPGDTYPPNTPAPATPAPNTTAPATLAPGDTYPPDTPAPDTRVPLTDNDTYPPDTQVPVTLVPGTTYAPATLVPLTGNATNPPDTRAPLTGNDTYPPDTLEPTAVPTPAPSSDDSPSVIVIIGIVAGGLIVLLILAAVAKFLFCKPEVLMFKDLGEPALDRITESEKELQEYYSNKGQTPAYNAFNDL